MNATQRVLAAILMVILGAYVARQTVRSVREIIGINDFEVFYHIGEVAADHRSDIYEVVSPVKIISLVVLCWGSIRFSGARPRDVLGWLLIVLAAIAAFHREIDSDVGNGQINIVLAAAAVGGVWLLMQARRIWWVGSLLLGVAIAIKLTPALLLAVPLLNRRWKQLGLTAVLTGLLLIALPMCWFGVENSRALAARHREITSRFTMDWPALGRQSTLNEWIQFTRVELRGDLHEQVSPEDPDKSPVISGMAGANLLDPSLRPQATRIWIVAGFIIGVGYLLVRFRLFSRRPADWTWDLAMLCALIVLLSPRAQKAHLAILIVPAAWIGARLTAWGDSMGWGRAWKSHPSTIILFSVMIAGFLVAENLPIPTFGLFDQPYRCVGLLALFIMIWLLCWLEAHGSGGIPALDGAGDSR